MKAVHSISTTQKMIEGALRRLLDIFVAGVGLVVLFPVFIFLAVLIKRDSPGPIYYWGPRVGRGGRIFKILKFRTMYEAPGSYAGPRVTAGGDQRITPVGRWLRATKLNELPQLWNVFIGEMSLVGPRPEDPTFVETWPAETRARLLSVRPGLTSPATVLYRDEEDLLAAARKETPEAGNPGNSDPKTSGDPVEAYLRSILPDKLALDERYLQQRTLLSDLDVLFWTLIALLPRLRRAPLPRPGTGFREGGLPGAATQLYWGPFSSFTQRIATWFAADLLVALGATGLAGVFWRLSGPFHLGWGPALAVAFGQALLFSLVNTALGIHRIYWAKAPAADALDLAVSSGLSLAGMFALNMWAWPAWLAATGRTIPAPLPPAMLAFTGLLAFLGFVAIRYRERLLTGFATRWLNLRGGGRLGLVRVLVVGAGEAARFGVWLLQKSDLAQAFTIVGLVDDDPRKQGLRIEGHPVLGTTADLLDLVRQHEIGLVMYAISRIRPADRERILAACSRTGVHVVRVPDLITVLNEQFSEYSPLAPVPPRATGAEGIVGLSPFPAQAVPPVAPTGLPPDRSSLASSLPVISSDASSPDLSSPAPPPVISNPAPPPVISNPAGVRNLSLPDSQSPNYPIPNPPPSPLLHSPPPGLSSPAASLPVISSQAAARNLSPSSPWQIPLFDLDYGPEEEEAALRVLRSKWLTMGEETQAFEQEFARMLAGGAAGEAHALAVGNATQALHLACLALGIGPGDEVIVPSLTFVATANAVRYTGAAVRFADVTSLADLTIAPASIAAQITPRTKAIIVMHYAGYPCDMPAILRLAAPDGNPYGRQLAVIEDAAHAPGAFLDGQALGTWGDVGCFSFFSNKNLAVGEGGMVVTRRPELAEKLRLLRSHGMTTLTLDRHRGRAYSYDVVDLGYNYRLDELRAALGRVQLARLAANNLRRRDLTRQYWQALGAYPSSPKWGSFGGGAHRAEGAGGLIILPFRSAFEGPDAGPVPRSAYHIFPLLLPEGVDRKAFMDQLRAEGIQSSIHYPAIHRFTAYQALGGIKLPVTEAAAGREITLPLYPSMTSSQVDRVAAAVIEALN